MKIGSCKLCKNERELKNSHIIPEFMYTPLYDKKHRFDMLSNHETLRTKNLQKGIREYLLCEQCEVVLSKYERYVSQILSGQNHIAHQRNGGLVHLDGVDYKKLRLFGLSVLWRASVSSLPIFKQVKLGPHEEKIRHMILGEDPGKPNKYPFILAIVEHQDEVQTRLIIQPTWTRSEGHYAYRFVMGGLVWIFIVSSHQPPSVISQTAVSEEGHLTMLISGIEDMHFVTKLVQEILQSGDLPASL